MKPSGGARAARSLSRSGHARADRGRRRGHRRRRGAPAASARPRSCSSCTGAGPCVARTAQALHVDRAVASEIDVNGKDYAIKLRAARRRRARAGQGRRALRHLHRQGGGRRRRRAPPASWRRRRRRCRRRRRPCRGRVAASRRRPRSRRPAAAAQGRRRRRRRRAGGRAAREATTPPPVQSEKKTFPWRPVAIAVAGGRAWSASPSASPLLAIDGDPTCATCRIPRTACPNVYNTVGGGAAMLTIGPGRRRGVGRAVLLRPSRAHSGRRGCRWRRCRAALC